MNADGYGMKIFNHTIEGFKNHPNFSKVFVIGLGCECAQIFLYKQQDKDDQVVYLNIQDEGGTNKIIQKVCDNIFELLPEINNIKRTPIPVSELVVALQCGGSDSYSGITANPALGYASDLIVQNGGSTILSETPEIYGAEHLLIERAIDKNIIEKLTKQIEWWKNYTKINNSSLNNNPSPGNKKGGLTTILEKSLGAVAKSGTSEMQDVLDYAEPIKEKGFNFMDSPGYDPVSVTGQVASGSNVICFTTGRGSCFGYKPVPSIKIATNTNMFNELEDDMDINAGSIMDGESDIATIGKKIYYSIIDTASGKLTKSEINGYGDDEFNPWVIGATL
jgi:altronate dehydratase